jgi:hypothetical protein
MNSDWGPDCCGRRGLGTRPLRSAGTGDIVKTDLSGGEILTGLFWRLCPVALFNPENPCHPWIDFWIYFAD